MPPGQQPLHTLTSKIHYITTPTLPFHPTDNGSLRLDMDGGYGGIDLGGTYWRASLRRKSGT